MNLDQNNIKQLQEDGFQINYSSDEEDKQDGSEQKAKSGNKEDREISVDEVIQKIVDDLWFDHFGNESKKHVSKEDDKTNDALVLSKEETEAFIK